MTFSWIFLLVKEPDDPDKTILKPFFAFLASLCTIELKVERRKNYDGFKTVKEIAKKLVR